MRLTLDEMIVSLSDSLTQMGATLDRLLVAAYAAERAERSQVVANLQADVDQHMAAMEGLVIDVLATQQPVLATDLSVVKGLLVASRQLGHIAHEQRDLAHLLEQVGIQDAHLPPEVKAVLSELREIVTASIEAFLRDDRIGAERTFARIARLEGVFHAVPIAPHPPTLVPVAHLHIFALGHVLDAARDIARSAPLYRYVSAPD
jgi:phosphate transport system protein